MRQGNQNEEDHVQLGRNPIVRKYKECEEPKNITKLKSSKNRRTL